MKLIDLENKLQNYKAGTFIKAAWEKNIESAKAKKLGLTIIKQSYGVVRTNISYRNIAKIKSDITATESKKPVWFEHYSRSIIQNKNDTDKKYIQLFPVSKNKIKSVYLIDGEVADPNTLYELGYITKSNLEHNDIITVAVALENLTSFGGDSL